MSRDTPSPPAPAGTVSRLLTFGLGRDTFALDAAVVREILDPVPASLVPTARPFVDRLVNVRGKVVPLADLRVLFGMPRTPPTADTRFIVVEAELEGEPTLVGLHADRVFAVTEAAPAGPAPVPAIGLRWPAACVRGIATAGGSLVFILDLPAVLGGREHPSGAVADIARRPAGADGHQQGESP